MMDLTTTHSFAENMQFKAKNDLINEILEKASFYMKGSQVMELNRTLNECFEGYEIFVDNKLNQDENYSENNMAILENFINTKKIEGASTRTMDYYKTVLIKLFEWADCPLPNIGTEKIREYLNYYQSLNGCSNTTLDNVRRVFSSFFNFCLDDGYIQINPMRRVKKIKSAKVVKKPFTDLEIEKMRAKLGSKPENTKIKQYEKIQKQALFELLLSSGIRLSECHQLNKQDIDLDNRTFIVLGKGNKERVCYFSVKAQFYLDKLINFKCSGRAKKFKDKEALFMSIRTAKRLGLNGIERHVRELGKSVGVEAHPHKFRRTFATTLVNKGVPIEQIKELLGHSNIDTTMIYAIVDQDQIKMNHNRYSG